MASICSLGGPWERGYSSAASLPQAATTQDHQNSEDDDVEARERESAETKPFPEVRLPVKAFYLGQRIDFQAMAAEYPLKAVPLSTRDKKMNDSLIILLSALDQTPNDLSDPGRYVVVYPYGSVVCCNLSHQEVDETLEIARHYTTKPFKNAQADDYRIHVQPSLKEWSMFSGDGIVLQRFDVNNLRVISSVLGQTVALYHYELQVHAMLDSFSNLNKQTESTGKFTMGKGELFSLVARLNSMNVNVITKVGLLKRSDTAWNQARYGQVWEGMRNDFEMEQRFEALSYKLDLLITQAKFYMEIQQNRKSDALEWIIIILISAEICVSLLDMCTR